MLAAMRGLILVLTIASAAGHYEKPPCQPDETPLSIAGVEGEICSPKCAAGDACPQDLPPGDVVKPRCALNGPDGAKHCALTCLFGKCPDGASCKWPPGAIVGYCLYPSSNFSTARSARTRDDEKLDNKFATLEQTSVSGKPAWNITTACSSLCQPDPEYSRTSWCKHKDRGGCCVEVNPNWSKVPGYKHMEDFCDKLCMPDGLGILAMCTPPVEFKTLRAADPRGAIDEFYEDHPSSCSDRIGDWVEPYCKSLLMV